MKKIWQLFIESYSPLLHRAIMQSPWRDLIGKLTQDLAKVESVTKTLQKENDISIGDIRCLFDGLLEEFPSMGKYLGKDSTIIANKDFENGIVKCISGKISELTFAERHTLRGLEKPVVEEPLEKVQKMGFAEKLLLEKKMQASDSIYVSMEWIPGTSNVCERLFSKAKITLGTLRKGMTPMHLEATLFLKANNELWDAKLVSKLL